MFSLRRGRMQRETSPRFTPFVYMYLCFYLIFFLSCVVYLKNYSSSTSLLFFFILLVFHACCHYCFCFLLLFCLEMCLSSESYSVLLILCNYCFCWFLFFTFFFVFFWKCLYETKCCSVYVIAFEMILIEFLAWRILFEMSPILSFRPLLLFYYFFVLFDYYRCFTVYIDANKRFYK